MQSREARRRAGRCRRGSRRGFLGLAWAAQCVHCLVRTHVVGGGDGRKDAVGGCIMWAGCLFAVLGRRVETLRRHVREGVCYTSYSSPAVFCPLPGANNTVVLLYRTKPPSLQLGRVAVCSSLRSSSAHPPTVASSIRCVTCAASLHHQTTLAPPAEECGVVETPLAEIRDTRRIVPICRPSWTKSCPSPHPIIDCLSDTRL